MEKCQACSSKPGLTPANSTLNTNSSLDRSLLKDLTWLDEKMIEIVRSLKAEKTNERSRRTRRRRRHRHGGAVSRWRGETPGEIQE
uniref:Phenolic glucoside malonyltransferase 2 n=1 Tax=Noccaea caerulescens TaxID=107243 RepID=A0A1J3GAQ9_NOCCA